MVHTNQIGKIGQLQSVNVFNTGLSKSLKQTLKILNINLRLRSDNK